MVENEGTIVKKAAEEQKQLAAQDPPVETVYDPTTKATHAPGQEGGFFVGGAHTIITPASPPQQNIQDLQQKMAALQAKLAALTKQPDSPSTTPPTPQQPPREPIKTPMFGVGIEQPGDTPKTTAKQPGGPIPQPREPIKTPMFGVGIEQPEPTPRPQPQPAPAPQQQLPPLAPSAPEDNPNTSPYGYIAYSADGQGFALVMDHLTQRDIDYFSYMAGYLHEKYPTAVPMVHPALMMKFAANHLLIDIRKTLADKVVCQKCHTEMPAATIQCPKCKALNRCPQCLNYIGGNFTYI